jgi:N-acetylglucosamine-6-sulfatase
MGSLCADNVSPLNGKCLRFGWKPSSGALVGFAVAATLVAQAVLPAGAGEGVRSQASTVTASAPRAEPSRPNIVLITTDDQRLRDLHYMPATRELLVRQGTSLRGLSPHPLCCPARAELVTGQYAHNNGVRSNRPPWGGYSALDESQTLATWLADAGYRNIFLGKYLNGYPPARPTGSDPGWHIWHPTVGGVYHYWDFDVRYPRSDVSIRSRYQIDFFTNLAVRQIRRYARADRPFFLWQSYLAPHTGCEPRAELTCWLSPRSAPRHRGLFATHPLETKESPAFNEADMSDKPLDQQALRRFGRKGVTRLVSMNRARLRALRAVDEGVADMVAALEASGELDNTLIFFTSDNGFLMGEHRIASKVWGYEPSIRVPLVVRGPGVPANHRRSAVATLLDIPATIIAAADAEPTFPMDGQDLIPVINGEDGQDTVLIVGGPRSGHEEEQQIGWFYRGVRTDRYTYIRYDATGEEELYDRRSDPHQIESVHDDSSYTRTLAELRSRTEALEDCVGDECHEPFGGVPGPRR